MSRGTTVAREVFDVETRRADFFVTRLEAMTLFIMFTVYSELERFRCAYLITKIPSIVTVLVRRSFVFLGTSETSVRSRRQLVFTRCVRCIVHQGPLDWRIQFKLVDSLEYRALDQYRNHVQS